MPLARPACGRLDRAVGRQGRGAAVAEVDDRPRVVASQHDARLREHRRHLVEAEHHDDVVAPALDGRFDLHSQDSGAVLGGRLAARAFTGWQKVKLGAELTGWVPGAEHLSTVAHAASFDARALVAVRLAHSFVAFNAGYRFDRSAAAGANAASLSPSDRLALGVSDFDAVLLGMGGGVDASAPSSSQKSSATAASRPGGS